MNAPLISVIVPVYNVEEFISQCIESVINQTYSNWELILINDCSPDSSDLIIKDYKNKHPDKIKYLINNHNCGQGISRNNGIEVAEGDWIFFLDSDDFIEPNCFEVLILALLMGNYNIIVSNFYSLRSDYKLSPRHNLIKLYNFSRYALGMYAWGTLFSRRFWINNKFYFTHYKYSEDLLLISRVISSTNNIKVLNDPLYVYRSNPKSATHKFYQYGDIAPVLESLLQFSCVENNGDEFIAFALSNSYNYIKMVLSPIARYKLFRMLKYYIPEYPNGNKFALDPLINASKGKKLKAMYLTRGLYFFWHLDRKIFKYLLVSKS